MTCNTCEGKRIVYGFGGMKHECKACKGTGKVDNNPVKVDKRLKQFRDDKNHKDSV